MTWHFLTVENIVALQQEQIEEFGGSHGLRDYGLLDSAVQRAENKVNYEPDSSVAEVAACLSYGLIKNHAFIDGNKRIGLVALVTFLHANGYGLRSTVAEEIVVVLKVAASEMGEGEWTAWVMGKAVAVG